MMLRRIPTIGAVRPANLEGAGRTVICRVARNGNPDWAGEWLVRCGSGSYATVTDFGTIRTVCQISAARIAEGQGMMTPEDLKKARNTLGLSQVQLAHILGTNPRTVRKWETVSGPNARGVNPIAAQVVRWMLDGFRPPEFPKK